MKLTPSQIRDMQWWEVCSHVGKDMTEVHEGYRVHGPCTTRELSQRIGKTVFTVRPRTTDLYQIGLVACTGKQGREGVYEYVSLEAASAAWAGEHTPMQKAQTKAAESEAAPPPPAPEVPSTLREQGNPEPGAVKESAASAAGRELRKARDRKAGATKEQMSFL